MPSMKNTDCAARSRPLLSKPKRWFAACGMRFRGSAKQRTWSDWHQMYQNNEHLKARLAVVRQTLRTALDHRASGPIRMLSICAGDGRDVLEEVATHPRRDDVEVWLIDSDAPAIVRGKSTAARFGIDRRVHFRQADAAAAENYLDIAPADILLVSGFIGRLTFDGLAHFAAQLPALCASGAELLWTRHVRGNQGMDITRVRELFRAHHFHERKFALASTNGYAVGWQNFVGTPLPLNPKLRLFDSRQLKDHWSGVSREAQDSAIGLLTFNRGRWSTRYRVTTFNVEIEIRVTTTEREPDSREIAAIAGLLEILPEQIRTLRRSTLMGWSYYPRRITAMRNGDITIRYRSSLRLLPSKTQPIVSPSKAGV